MNHPVPRAVRRTPRLAVHLGLVAIGMTLLLFTACGESTTEPGTPNADAGAVELARDAAGIADVDDANFISFRDCDDTWSVFTVDGIGSAGSGTGRTRDAAKKAAIEDAIAADVSLQFYCRLCPDSKTKKCKRFFRTFFAGAAELRTGDDACEYDEKTKTWKCSGWVDFHRDTPPLPAVQAGCSSCDDDDKEESADVTPHEFR